MLRIFLENLLLLKCEDLQYSWIPFYLIICMFMAPIIVCYKSKIGGMLYVYWFVMLYTNMRFSRDGFKSYFPYGCGLIMMSVCIYSDYLGFKNGNKLKLIFLKTASSKTFDHWALLLDGKVYHIVGND